MFSEDGYRDTPVEYIKVCESLRDSRRLWNSETWDYIYDPADEEAGVQFCIHQKI
jgi:hypothetical protein